jgi:ribokinase
MARRTLGCVFDVTVIGSANLDLVVRTDRHPTPGETVLGSGYAEYPGGKGLNQAVAAARAGATTAFVGAVGDDDAGRILTAIASDDHIDRAQLTVVPDVPTGRAVITVDDTGENTIVVVPGANRAVNVASVPRCSVALLQLEIPLDAVQHALAAARETGSTIVLNPAPAATLAPELLRLCDIVVPNEHEVELLGGVEALLGHGVQSVIVTRGGAGVDIHSAGGATTHVPAIDTVVVDTTGAGDAFCGNLAARLAAGDTIELAARWAVVAGGLAVSRNGAIPSLPYATEVTALLDW